MLYNCVARETGTRNRVTIESHATLAAIARGIAKYEADNPGKRFEFTITRA